MTRSLTLGLTIEHLWNAGDSQISPARVIFEAPRAETTTPVTPQTARQQTALDVMAARERATAEEDLKRKSAPTPLERNIANARRTHTGRSVVDEARRRGVPIHVLPDREYDRRHPGTGGVTVNGEVILPARALANPRDSSVLVHELTHAIVGDAIRTDRPLSDRIARTRAAFQSMGLDPRDGELIARATQDWRDTVAAEHVATSLLTRDVRREQARLPREDPSVRAAVIQLAAERENALPLIRRRDAASSGKGPAYSDRQFVADWLSTSQGRLFPPQGSTDAERAADLDRFLERFRSDAYINPTSDA